VIEAYIDESGTHRGAPLLAVAAYFAAHGTWGRFNRDWDAILKQHNISCFHATESECDALRPSLAKLIEDCKLRGVVAAVPRPVYDQYASAQVKGSLGDAYRTCVTLCVIKTCRLVKEHYPDRSVSFFIEDGQPNTESLLSNLRLLMEDHALDSDCAPIASVDLARKDLAPLQTADFLSHVHSTSDLVWINDLTKRGRIYVAPIDEDVLKGSSTGIKRMFAQQRKRRKLAKQQNISGAE
jgi:hypothetical protein